MKLTPNSSKTPPAQDSKADIAQFMCPMNLKEMNGSQPFVYLWTCGCVFSQAGLRAVSSTPPPKDDISKNGKDPDENAPSKQLDVCPQCAAKYDKSTDVLLLNPPPEDEAKMRAAMTARRASEPAKKGKKRKAAAAEHAGEPPAKAKKVAPAAPSINGNISTASRKVVEDLAEEEAKRKAQMSDAVRSLYVTKGAPQRKETFMTMGTFTRVRGFLHSELQCNILILSAVRIGSGVELWLVLFPFVYAHLVCIHVLYHYYLPEAISQVHLHQHRMRLCAHRPFTDMYASARLRQRSALWR